MISGCAFSANVYNDDRIERQIRAVLDAQVAAWNDGDIDGYMQGYWNDERLRFASGGTVQQGWLATRDRYHRAYPDRATMGTLAFSDLDIRALTNDDAYVFGRYTLVRDEDRPTGLFTLVFKRHADGWHIVHDHTSAE